MEARAAHGERRHAAELESDETRDPRYAVDLESDRERRHAVDLEARRRGRRNMRTAAKAGPSKYPSYRGQGGKAV